MASDVGIGGSTQDSARDDAVELDGRAADLSRLDFEAVAQQIVDSVISVTDFKVATITVREGDRCRRLATAGLPDGRIGMTTPFEQWSSLLREEWRRGSRSYLIPPEAPAQWADIPDLAPSDDPNAWTAEHGLVLPLCDYDGETVGFVAVDEPRSGILPDDATVERLEAFARHAEAAFVNAHLYAVAQRQAVTMRQLFDVAKTMASTTDLDQVVPRIIDAMRNRYDAFEVTVGRIVGPHVELRTQRRGSDRGLKTTTVPLAGPLDELRQELERVTVLVINDLDDRPEIRPFLTPGTAGLLIGGVNDGEDRVVILAVSSDTTSAFDAEDAEFLRGLLDITTVAIRNADLYEEVRFAAERDALTGLRNRRMFWSTVAAMLQGASSDHPMTLAVADIDNFKALNDAHGHDVGDRALVHVAGRLEAGVRETDAVFRIGGEEFVLMLPGTSGRGAVAALSRIREGVKRSRLDLPAVSVSIGGAVATSPDADPDALFAAADAALYRAKRAGKDRIVLDEFDDESEPS